MNVLLDLIFPPICVHCRAQTSHRKYPLCAHCVTLIELADRNDRCPSCFQTLRRNHRCDRNLERGAVFDSLSPASSLLYYFEKKHCFGLAPSLAAFMVLQLVQLQWPLPDIVIPIPTPFFRMLGTHYKPNQLLAENIATICNAKMVDCLKCGFDHGVYWKQANTITIADRHVLMVAGSTIEEKTLLRAAKCLREGFPKTLKFLSVQV